jgi:hypothetical protein
MLTETERDKRLSFKCRGCRQHFVVAVNETDYEDWRRGAKLAQQAFPYLSIGGRELLITGYCGDCYDWDTVII